MSGKIEAPCLTSYARQTPLSERCEAKNDVQLFVAVGAPFHTLQLVSIQGGKRTSHVSVAGVSLKEQLHDRSKIA